MSIFDNKFFSVEGQKERLSNVGETLKAAVTGKGVVANTPSNVANKVLGYAASNPFLTAAPIAVARNPAATLGAIKNTFNALPAAGKIGVVAGAPVVVGAVVSNPGLISKAANAPRELSEFGGDVGNLIANPSLENAKETFQNSPIISSVIGAGTAIAIGAAATGTIATIANTRAVKANTAIAANPSNAFVPTGQNQVAPTVPLTPATTVIGREVSSRVPGKRASKKRSGTGNQTVRVQILNQQTYISGQRRGNTWQHSRAV